MKRTRRNHGVALKTQVAIAASSANSCSSGSAVECGA